MIIIVLTFTQKDTVIIGTLFKEMEMKPCILNNIIGVLGNKKFVDYVSDGDYSILEDKSGRIRIKEGKIYQSEKFITGTIVALR
jgi:hypothetical protein